MQFSIAFVMRSDDLITYSPTRQRSGPDVDQYSDVIMARNLKCPDGI